MKIFATYFKYFILFAWSFYSASSYAVETITLSWEVTYPVKKEKTKIFTTVFLEQPGDTPAVTYSTYNSAEDSQQLASIGLERSRIDMPGEEDSFSSPVRQYGPSVVRILADNLIEENSQTDGYFNPATERTVSFSLFPVHLFSRFGRIPESFVIDRVHRLGPDTVYATLRAPDYAHHYWDAGQTTGRNVASESGRIAQSNTVQRVETFSNEGFADNVEGAVAGDVVENNSVTTQDFPETETRFEISVILQRSNFNDFQSSILGILQNRAQTIPAPYRLIVVDQALNDESVTSLLDENAEQRVYFEVNLELDTIRLLPGLSVTEPQRNRENLNIQPVERQSVRQYVNQFFLTYFLCCCVKSRK